MREIQAERDREGDIERDKDKDKDKTKTKTERETERDRDRERGELRKQRWLGPINRELFHYILHTLSLYLFLNLSSYSFHYLLLYSKSLTK